MKSKSIFTVSAVVSAIAVMYGTPFLLASCSLSMQEDEDQNIENVPDRYVQMAPNSNPDAGEGAKAKREEGKTGARNDAKGLSDKEVAGNSGVLGALRDGGRLEGFGGSMDADMAGGVGGLIGTQGKQIGSGGMGRRGQGLGGGGTAEGLGGLGTKGVGSGSSGYGAGGGHFGAKGGSSSRARAAGGIRISQIGTRGRHGDIRNAPVEQFVDHGVNQVTLVSDDALSTFAADVDTASYTVARRMLNQGRMPPASAVRVEEFVNYFPYPTPDPKGREVFAVKAEAAPSPWNRNRTVLRVGVNTKEPDLQNRKPMALTFLVDTSCSMTSSDKIGLAKNSLKTLVNNLTPEDSVAMATYAGSSRIVLPPTSIVHKQRVLDAIDDLTTRGSTAMGAGMTMAYNLADKAYRTGIENRVIILSDGDANVGARSHDALLDQIKEYAGKGITLSTIGFGQGNYRDNLMEQLANKGDGNSFYIDSQREGDRIFGKKILGTLQTLARDVKFQVEFNPEAVNAYRLVGYENRDVADKDFRNDAVDAGEIGRGHSVTALYELVLKDAPQGSLATVRIRHKKPGKDVPATETEYSVPQSVLRQEWASASRSYRIALGSATFAEILRKSPHVAEIRYGDVAKMVRGAVREGIAEDKELLSLIEKAARLSGEGSAVSNR